MESLLQFLLVYYFFGPAVAIPFSRAFMGLLEAFLWTVMTQVFMMVVFFVILDMLEYQTVHKRYIVEKFCRFTNKRMKEVQNNTETILQRFTNKFGHLGYYLSIAFLSFSIGFMWAALLAYILKLKRKYAFIAILCGSTFSFCFWYLIVEASVNIISPEVFMMFGVVFSFLLLFYGRIREQKIMLEIKDEMHYAKRKIKKMVKKK